MRLIQLYPKGSKNTQAQQHKENIKANNGKVFVSAELKSHESWISGDFKFSRFRFRDNSAAVVRDEVATTKKQSL